ncbi:MAG: hypothetical protein AVDCRST_MAG52-2037, partial [uncultured Blastococcus sp.]
ATAGVLGPARPSVRPDAGPERGPRPRVLDARRAQRRRCHRRRPAGAQGVAGHLRGLRGARQGAV